MDADIGADNKRFISKTENFSEILRHAKAGVKEEILSDKFYTGCYGYKLQVIVRPYTKGWTQLADSLYFGITSVQAKYDDILPWPFRKNMTFTVIDQNEDLKERENITADLRPSSKAPIFCDRPTEHLSFGSDRMYFVPHERLQARRFILDDNLFLQVDVGPDDWIIHFLDRSYLFRGIMQTELILSPQLEKLEAFSNKERVIHFSLS